jgi:hypothetical protein
MHTGDKVLLLLIAKVACCGLLALAATGALGGVLTWLITGSTPLVILGLFGAAIIAIVWRSRSDPTDVDSAPHLLHPPEKSARRPHVSAERADATLPTTAGHERSASS